MDQGALEPIETASRDAVRALQLTRLQDSLARAAAAVPHTRDAFAAAGVAPDNLRSLDDLARFPFTTKDDLRRNYPWGMFAVPMPEIIRIHASSGTTGTPTVVGYTRDDIATWAALVARSLRAAGARPGDRVHVAYGYGLFTGGLGLHYGAEALGCAAIPVSVGQTERQVQLIRDFRPDIIAATPSYLLAIADECERQGLDGPNCSLRIAVCGAEPWTEGMRAEIEARLGLAALDIYGLSEVMGPGIAQECAETRDGLTLWEDHFLPEIIDPVTGTVLPEGEEGELVLTTLTRQAMPLVRYRTRDLTRLLPPGPARPGMRRMARIKGRSDDMLIIRGVNLFPSQVEAALAEEPRLAPHYLLEVTRPARLDELEVVVELRPELAGRLTEAEGAALERDTAAMLRGRIGLAAALRVVPPGTIERSQGKARRVFDRRPKA